MRHLTILLMLFGLILGANGLLAQKSNSGKRGKGKQTAKKTPKKGAKKAKGKAKGKKGVPMRKERQKEGKAVEETLWLQEQR